MILEYKCIKNRNEKDGNLVEINVRFTARTVEL